MKPMYFYQPGFNDDSVIYEIKLKEVARLKNATFDEVESTMDSIGIAKLVIDAGYPNIIERFKINRHVAKLMRRPNQNKEEQVNE